MFAKVHTQNTHTERQIVITTIIIARETETNDNSAIRWSCLFRRRALQTNMPAFTHIIIY